MQTESGGKTAGGTKGKEEKKKVRRPPAPKAKKDVIPDGIKKMNAELDKLQADIHEKQKDIGILQRKERALNNRINSAWKAQHDKIISAVMSIAGE